MSIYLVFKGWFLESASLERHGDHNSERRRIQQSGVSDKRVQKSAAIAFLPLNFVRHPNLHKVLFQREQAAPEVTILQLEAGGARRPKRRKVIAREQKIKTLADELANGDRDIDSYISVIRHCIEFS